MSRVSWDDTGERLYHTGIDRGMIYLEDGTVSTWSGLVSVTESPTGGDAVATYLDGQKILNIPGGVNYEATIESLSLPILAAASAGWGILQYGLYASNQVKSTFGFSYRTLIGNDIEGTNFAYKIHLVYGCTAKNSDFTHETAKDQPSVRSYSWGVTAVPVTFAGRAPTAHAVFDTRNHAILNLTALENILYGSDSSNPRMPTIDEITVLLAS